MIPTERRRLAHELNNPLTAILGYCQLLLADATLTPLQRDSLERIREQGCACGEIVRRLGRGDQASNL